MNPKKTPRQQVNDEYGSKAKLVDKVLGLIERGEEDAGDLKARLLKASNRKLMRLATVSTAIKEKYGSVDKLVEAIAQKLGKAKDSDFMNRLRTHTPTRLLDLARSLAGEPRRPPKAPSNPRPDKPRAKAAATSRKAAAKKGKPAVKKAPAKKGARKSPAKKSAKR